MTKRSKKTPRDLLTPAALHMLLALARGDLHGLGIKQDVEARTGGKLRLGPGTLYEAIHRMEADGWITEIPDAEDARRKVYRLTRRGRAVMLDEVRRLDEIVRFATDEVLSADERKALGGRTA
jgi:DNA-binding PadR family transcriptional regulator